MVRWGGAVRSEFELKAKKVQKLERGLDVLFYLGVLSTGSARLRSSTLRTPHATMNA